MDPGVTWAVVGVAITAIVGVYTVITYYRANPKRRLEYAVEVVRLVAAPTAIENLDVRVNGLQIQDPHLVTLRVFSNSRADIPSDAFDAARSLVFRVEPGGALLLSETNEGIRIGPGSGYGFDWAEFPVKPQLIKKRASGSITFVSAGLPGIVIEDGSPLIDISVRRVSPPPEHASNPFASRRLASLSMAILAALSIVSAASITALVIDVITKWSTTRP
ncbi:MAG: hypothetical protein PGN24_06100 [Microbacterium arborescens]